MSENYQEYELHIRGSYTPDIMPMILFAEYTKKFAELLGEKENVHFDGIKKGSVGIACKVDNSATTRVNARLEQIDDVKDASIARIYRELNNMLANDNAEGELLYTDKQNKKIIPFPGCNMPKAIDYGKITERGSLDGLLTGLRQNSDGNVAIELQDGERIHRKCYANINLAKELKEHLFTEVIRIHGVGKWHRDNGVWIMENFIVESFDTLDNRPLNEVVKDLRAIKTGWENVENPFIELQNLRDNTNNGLH